MRQFCFSRVCSVITLCVFFAVCGCASLGTPPLVHPSRLGMELDISAILDHAENYTVYFSARSFNPSALLFVPKDSPYTVIPEKRGLGEGWNPVEDKTAITTMVGIIEDRDRLEHPVLKALLRPLERGVEPTAADVLGYVYSCKSTYARPVDDGPNAYKVYQIPEIPRMGDRDDEILWWRGGFRP